jgi:hypothetical protein
MQSYSFNGQHVSAGDIPVSGQYRGGCSRLDVEEKRRQVAALSSIKDQCTDSTLDPIVAGQWIWLWLLALKGVQRALRTNVDAAIGDGRRGVAFLAEIVHGQHFPLRRGF